MHATFCKEARIGVKKRNVESMVSGVQLSWQRWKGGGDKGVDQRRKKLKGKERA